VEPILKRLLTEVHAALRDELAEMVSECGRVRALLGEAVSGLSESFVGLAKHADAQKEVLETLLVSMGSGRKVDSGAGSPSMDAFVRECAGILQSLAANLGELSSHNSDSVASIDALTAHFDKSMALLSEIENISNSAHFLALNARIEAAHAGDAGRGFAVVAAEVQQVSKDSREVAERVSDSVGKVRGALDKVRGRMDEAANRGAEVASDSRQKVDGVLGELDGLGRSVADCLAQLTHITADVNETAARAIQALQFEDIVGQLIGTMVRRVERLQVVSEAVKAAIGPDGVAHALALLERAQEITKSAPVQQTSMTAGGAELF
jgi:methyl-accepting chemotaxis protein